MNKQLGVITLLLQKILELLHTVHGERQILDKRYIESCDQSKSRVEDLRALQERAEKFMRLAQDDMDQGEDWKEN